MEKSPNHNGRTQNEIDDRELLIRIDEKVISLDERFEKFNGSFIKLKEDLAANYISKEEFRPIKNVVWGGVKLILLSVGSGLLYLIIKH